MDSARIKADHAHGMDARRVRLADIRRVLPHRRMVSVLFLAHVLILVLLSGAIIVSRFRIIFSFFLTANLIAFFREPFPLYGRGWRETRSFLQRLIRGKTFCLRTRRRRHSFLRQKLSSVPPYGPLAVGGGYCAACVVDAADDRDERTAGNGIAVGGIQTRGNV